MNMYVGNLDFKVKENDLTELFEDYGTVSSAKLITDQYSGKSRGFGFVTMENNLEAQKAMEELDGATYENRQLVVNEAKERKNNNKRY